MKSSSFSRKLSLVLVLFAGTATPVAADPYSEAAGHIFAALMIAEECSGLATVDKGTSSAKRPNGFEEASLDILQAQGLKRNRLAKLIYYGKTNSLLALGAEALAKRGVSGTPSMCKFGNSVVGKRDEIGQFLVKGD